MFEFILKTVSIVSCAIRHFSSLHKPQNLILWL